jgi:hypothetical protein
MLSLSLTLAALLFGGITSPVQAADGTAQGWMADLVAADTRTDEIAKRRKPRVPGGSGCDDPEDLVEYPECRI